MLKLRDDLVKVAIKEWCERHLFIDKIFIDQIDKQYSQATNSYFFEVQFQFKEFEHLEEDTELYALRLDNYI